jgi:hypothetical protein
MEKYLFFIIGENSYALHIKDVHHILSVSSIYFEMIDKDKVNYVQIKDKKFPTFDFRNLVIKTSKQPKNVIITDCIFLETKHFQEIGVHYELGFLVDDILKIGEAIKVEGRDIVKFDGGIFPLIDFIQFLEDKNKITEIIKKLNKLKEQRYDVSKQYDAIFKRNKIIEIWKKSHPT